MAVLNSILKPESSVLTGLAEGAAIVAIYTASLPNTADVRTAAPHNTDVEAARKRAAWTSGGVLGVIFLLTRDLNSFLIGGAVLAAIDFHYKHADAVSPATGKATLPPAEPDQASVHPLHDYADATGELAAAGY